MKVQERTKASRAQARLGARVVLLCVCVAAPAVGQGPGQGQGTSCVQRQLACVAEGLDGGAGICSSYSSCYVTATDSIYYTVDDRRFDCDGLTCTQAEAQLNAYCCPAVNADAGTGPVLYTDGCALGRTGVSSNGANTGANTGASSGSLALLALASLLGLRRRASRA